MSTFKSTLHLCNTFFEWELQQENIPDLETAFEQNHIFLQLQYLPLLYAPKLEPILVTDIPKNFDHAFALLRDPPKGGVINSWGYSRSIAEWAKKHHLTYLMPPWETVIFMSMGHQNLLISAFQTISSTTTAGFNTIDLRLLSRNTLFLLMILMLYGGVLTGNGVNVAGSLFKKGLKLTTTTFFYYLVLLSIFLPLFFS